MPAAKLEKGLCNDFENTGFILSVRHLKKFFIIEQEIQRNIISDEAYRRYEQTIQDVHRRLQRENEEFEELLAFVHETRDRLSYEKTDNFIMNDQLF